MTMPSKSLQSILIVHIVVEKHEVDKYDFGLPIIGFCSRKRAIQYKRDRKDRALIVRKLEIH